MVEKKATSYSVEDAIKIADEIMKLGKDKKYNLGAFIHGLIFAQEYAIYSYKVPQQQIAIIKRDCHKYFKNINNQKKP
ncbi:MAG: hypothetical protein BV457_02410 [Thermoplasmata archaeon M9B1D]|nr:MAG: hypothetical protein BV457_02410 [Thermoplasmata archaeon M9B1D]PNX49634.1 MAG: hypothetical protein BV456_08755 [Thermoplasmata archaeon M8B2D]